MFVIHKLECVRVWVWMRVICGIKDHRKTNKPNRESRQIRKMKVQINDSVNQFCLNLLSTRCIIIRFELSWSIFNESLEWKRLVLTSHKFVLLLFEIRMKANEFFSSYFFFHYFRFCQIFENEFFSCNGPNYALICSSSWFNQSYSTLEENLFLSEQNRSIFLERLKWYFSNHFNRLHVIYLAIIGSSLC